MSAPTLAPEVRVLRAQVCPLCGTWWGPVPSRRVALPLWGELVDEPAHQRTQGQRGEELPLLYQYVCLDRLGASVGSKQGVYNALLKLARERYP